MNLLVTFVIFNILNVIIQTVKSIATIKCNKWVASLVNAVAYGLYTYIVVLTVCELPLWVKMLVVAVANLIGVFVVKWLEEKSRKDKLWKFECTILKKELPRLQELLKLGFYDIPYNYIDIDKYCIINFYCATQQQSTDIKNLFEQCNFEVKYFVSESKI
jgi:hypothetical protein